MCYCFVLRTSSGTNWKDEKLCLGKHLPRGCKRCFWPSPPQTRFSFSFSFFLEINGTKDPIQCKNGCWIDILLSKLKIAWVASLEIIYSFEFCTGEQGWAGKFEFKEENTLLIRSSSHFCIWSMRFLNINETTAVSAVTLSCESLLIRSFFSRSF